MNTVKKFFDYLLQWTVDIAELRARVAKQNVWY